MSAPHEERSGPAQRLGPPQADGLRQAAPRPRSFIPPRQRGLFAGGPPPSSGSFGRHVTSVWRRDVRTAAALSAATSGQLPLAVLHSLNLVPKPSKCDERRWERRDQTHRRPDRGGLPDWSSEGTRIAFAGDRDDNINIYCAECRRVRPETAQRQSSGGSCARMVACADVLARIQPGEAISSAWFASDYRGSRVNPLVVSPPERREDALGQAPCQHGYHHGGSNSGGTPDE